MGYNTRPTQITWSTQTTNFITYRAACTIGNDSFSPFWIGGSKITYNYNGIAYNRTWGVSPRTTARSAISGGLIEESTPNINLPIDLRGIASIDYFTKYIAGGMLSEQTVRNKTFQIQP